MAYQLNCHCKNFKTVKEPSRAWNVEHVVPDSENTLVTIDGLIISNWSREVFQDMRAGGLTAANCTFSVWENFRDTIANIMRLKKWLADNSDLVMEVRTADDIETARRTGRTGIIQGWQNLSAIEDRIDLLDVFHDLGLRIAQLTYNTRNLVGSGCWESVDGGLSDFGHAVVERLNKLGILIDLSHVGTKTSEETIVSSSRPVAYTHVAPKALKDHPRNKSDRELRMIIDAGGFVGYCTYPAFLPNGTNSSLKDCIKGLEHMINTCGEDNVGIGTDFTQNQPLEFFQWLRRDKGVGAYCVPGTPQLPVLPKGLERLNEYPNLRNSMHEAGWTDERVAKVMGKNWLRFLAQSWEPGTS